MPTIPATKGVDDSGLGSRHRGPVRHPIGEELPTFREIDPLDAS